jgi:hypothetical protein
LAGLSDAPRSGKPRRYQSAHERRIPDERTCARGDAARNAAIESAVMTVVASISLRIEPAGASQSIELGTANCTGGADRLRL